MQDTIIEPLNNRKITTPALVSCTHAKLEIEIRSKQKSAFKQFQTEFKPSWSISVESITPNKIVATHRHRWEKIERDEPYLFRTANWRQASRARTSSTKGHTETATTFRRNTAIDTLLMKQNVSLLKKNSISSVLLKPNSEAPKGFVFFQTQSFQKPKIFSHQKSNPSSAFFRIFRWKISHHLFWWRKGVFIEEKK